MIARPSRRTLCFGSAILGAGALSVIGRADALGAAPMGRSATLSDLHSRIPFEFDPGGHLIVEVTVGQVSVPGVLDTGAGVNAIDPALKVQLGLSVVSTGRVAGVTAAYQADSVTLPVMSIGSRMLPPSRAVVADLGGISASIGRPIKVVLGRPFFEHVRVELDFSNSELLIIGDHGAVPACGDALPLRSTEGGALATTAELCGKTIIALYDLGSGIPIYVSPAFAAESGLLRGRKVSQTATVGAEGLTVSAITTVETLTIGRSVLRDVPVQVPPRWDLTEPAVVGSPVWARFRNLIDLRGQRLCLEPEAAELSAPFQKDRSGIGALRLPDRLRVAFVAPNSPANHAGLKAGDEIISIDGAPVDALLYIRRPRPGSESAGTVLSLRLKSGRDLALHLADYY